MYRNKIWTTLWIQSRRRSVINIINGSIKNCMIVKWQCSMVGWVLCCLFWSKEAFELISCWLDYGSRHISLVKRFHWWCEFSTWPLIRPPGPRLGLRIFFPRYFFDVESLNSNQSLDTNVLQISGFTLISAICRCRRGRLRPVKVAVDLLYLQKSSPAHSWTCSCVAVVPW